jgi:hypothetical protein
MTPPPGEPPSAAGWGLITFYVDDAAEMIQIFHLLWAG